jgi:hypothetical protein
MLCVATIGMHLACLERLKNFTAAMAIPTPKRTPARTRFDPPSPNANVRPDTTIATSERPRAMVLVNACCRTLTAFSHGELPACANAGAARHRATREERTARLEHQNERPSNVFSFFDSSARVVHRDKQCEGSPHVRLVPGSYGRNALVQRHARLVPNNLARCVLTPLHGRRRDLRVNFRLSSNSVFREKNVSRANENISTWPRGWILSGVSVYVRVFAKRRPRG